MKIEYRTGNVLRNPERFIVHGCNAQGAMNSGIAKQIRDEHPKVYEFYRQEYVRNGNKLSVGHTQWVKSDPYTFINGITQEFYGRNPNVVYVSYDGLRSVMRAINTMMAKEGSAPVAMPLIGAGLANGSWKTISEIIEAESTDFQPVVYLYDGNMPQS